MTASTSVALIETFGGELFGGVYDLLTYIVPLAFGMFIFYIGYGWVRRAVGGR